MGMNLGPNLGQGHAARAQVTYATQTHRIYKMAVECIKVKTYPTLNDVRYLRPVDRYIVGLDVGKSIDNSALAVMHHTIKSSGTFF
jgi:hypothetical protein